MNTDIRALTERGRSKRAPSSSSSPEVGKVIVGQRYMLERLLIGLLVQRPRAARGRARPGQDARGAAPSPTPSAPASAASSSRPTCCPPTSSARMIYNPQDGELHRRARARSSPTWCWPTRSTAPRPRCSRRCSRRCRSGRSPSATRPSRCPTPFLVLATQNPIEQEGTYPLPEAQVDRFMLKVKVGYPTREEERADPGPHERAPTPPQAQKVIDPRADLARARERRPAASTWTRRSRTTSSTWSSPRASPRALRPQGPGAATSSTAPRPRATICLTPGGAGPRLPAPPRLRHPRGRQGGRPSTCCATASSLTYEAEAEELTTEKIIQRVFDRVEVP